MVLDKSQAVELALYIENDGNIYRRMTTPLIQNYARKKIRGNYNKTLALKGILNLVEVGRKGYIRDFGGLGGPVSKETKLYAANELYPYIDEASTFEAKKIKMQLRAKSKLKTIRKKKKK